MLPCIAGAALSATAAADDVVGDRLTDLYPGLRTVEHVSGRMEAFYGVPMLAAATPEAAAELFLFAHAQEFGVGEFDWEFTQQTTVRNGRFTAFQFEQSIDGLAVQGGNGRILVLDRGSDHAVVYASGKLAMNDDGDLDDIVFVNADQALDAAQGDVRFADFVEWSEPELIAFFNKGDGAKSAVTRPAWRTKARHVGFPIVSEAYEIIIDAETGEQLFVGSLVHSTDVDGTARGLATPGTAPDIATNPATEQDLPLLEVMIRGGASAVTELDGSFTIPFGGTDPVTVDAELSGPFVRIVNDRGSELTASTTVTPPGPAMLLFNETPSEFETSQVNTLIGTNLTYDLMKTRAPGFTGLDRQTVANVNLNDSCNAFFSGFDLSINFFRNLGGCVNTAFSTVIAHEYGHFIVNRLGLAQGAFGEGYGDSVAIMLYDTGIVGEQFFGPGSGPIRRPETARQQFPCSSGAIHTCGQILGGTWRWTRLNLGDTLGSAEGLEVARDLFVGWSLITLGGEGLNSANPRTAIEVLTIDDDDGILGNGTPNYDDICAAFDRHGVDCPALDTVVIELVESPAALDPGASGDVVVSIEEVSASLVDGSLELNVIADGSTQTIAFTPSGDDFTASIPGQDAFTDLSFFVTGQASDGTSLRFPPARGFVVPVGAVVAIFDYEDSTGWTTQDIALTDGGWNFDRPRGAGDDRDEDPPVDFDGSGAAALTDSASGNSDVDGGPTRLISPVFDLSGATDPQLSYARWFRNDDQDIDNMLIEVSDDGGASWSILEDVSDEPVGWVVREFRIADVAELTDGFRVRFSVTDNPNDSVTEAGIDRFWILDDAGSSCPADIDGDGSLTIFDFLAFQTAFDAGDPIADFDGDGSLTIFDFLAFQTAFDAGCP
ncbi:MAG: GC-type dockerin domain-anchored protein [Planctomycetota bacterium]